MLFQVTILTNGWRTKETFTGFYKIVAYVHLLSLGEMPNLSVIKLDLIPT